MKEKNITIDELARMMQKGFVGVDKKLEGVKNELKMDMIHLEDRMDRKLEKMEESFNRKLDKLTTTLDKFLKRMTDMEDEFTMMRHDIDRMKKVIKEKLGVELS